MGQEAREVRATAELKGAETKVLDGHLEAGLGVWEEEALLEGW